jgi:hypothetical protein
MKASIAIIALLASALRHRSEVEHDPHAGVGLAERQRQRQRQRQGHSARASNAPPVLATSRI